MLNIAAISTLVAIGVMVSAARCYPPGSRVVVFVQGVYSVYYEEGTAPVGVEDHAFDKLKAKFVDAKYDPAQLLDFSYAGGAVDDAGNWVPEHYPCELTDRPADRNLAALESMLRGYRARHPDAHFTLIGHSLGGYLVYLEGVREAQRPEDQRLGVDAVVTLDAPLLGVGADKKLVLDLAISCDKTYQAAAELVLEKEDPALEEKRRAEVEAMRAAGIRLATLGNRADCLFNLPRCTTGALSRIDDSETQFLDNADLVKRYEIQSNEFLSHFAIFTFPQALIDIPQFVGAP